MEPLIIRLFCKINFAKAYLLEVPINKLSEKIKTDDDFYYDLLRTVISNPKRYIGIFRLSNVKTKLIQNVTQSREIKFGDFMEDIITDYIADMGYKNLDKNIGCDEAGNSLNADQVFVKGKTLYLIEQKMRDDHDSTKKRGQWQNFQKKYTLLREQYTNFTIIAIMWFIDDGLVKNKKYYMEEAILEKIPNLYIKILYGKELFNEVFDRIDVWNEICGYLIRNKNEQEDELISIPDFDTSKEIEKALINLQKKDPILFKKLKSNKEEYVQLRKEIFPTNKIVNGRKNKTLIT